MTDTNRVPIDRAFDGALLDRLPTGVLLLGIDAVPRYANLAARTALACGAAGLCMDGPRVLPVLRTARAAWTAALVSAAAGTVTMLRLGEAVDHRAIALSPWRARSSLSGALCTLPAGESQEASTLSVWARAHGLSASESSILIALSRGITPKAVARVRGASEGTVRTQIKSMLFKTGHHGIRELVIDALRSAPVPIER
jgi:DNA-binding CsgD family transcriptional regulator